ncbi:MAG: glycosidase [Acidimicrobiales bacterium]
MRRRYDRPREEGVSLHPFTKLDDPILEPVEDSWWESRAVFNPSVVVRDGRFHLLYRAVSADDEPPEYVSRLGYATSADGIDFTRHGAEPVFQPDPRHPEDLHGIEDPRITVLDGRTYVTYVAIDVPALTTSKLSRTALAVTADFTSFERLGVLTPLPDIDDRDWALFPSRLGGRYAMLTRPQSVNDRLEYVKWGTTDQPAGIWLATSDSLTHWEMDRDAGNPVEIGGLAPRRPWEGRKTGIGPAPIETEDGWLAVYHGKDRDNAYYGGLALLDLDDPTRVLARLPEPFLAPEQPWERKGDLANCVYPSGAVVSDGALFVYYGAADDKCGVTTAGLDDVLRELRRHPAPRP